MPSETKDNFGLIARFLGFVVDVITLAALMNTKVAPRIPFIDYPLGLTAKLTLWVIALVSYLGVLRAWWLPTTKKVLVRPAESFAEFVIFDILLGFKYWYMLLPFIVLAGFLVGIFVEMGVRFWVIAFIVLVIVLFVSSTVEQQNRDEQEQAKLDKPEVYNLWLKRIKKELSELGYATSHDLSILHNEPASICRKALNKYFKQYEVEENLILVLDHIQVPGESSPRSAYVLARRTLASSKPWISNPRR